MADDSADEIKNKIDLTGYRSQMSVHILYFLFFSTLIYPMLLMSGDNHWHWMSPACDVSVHRDSSFYSRWVQHHHQSLALVPSLCF